MTEVGQIPNDPEITAEFLEEKLSEMPPEWIPMFVSQLIELGYANKVWQPGGASRLVKQAEKELGKRG